VWKFSVIIVSVFCLLGCQQQPPARVVAVKPTIKRVAAKHTKKMHVVADRSAGASANAGPPVSVSRSEPIAAIAHANRISQSNAKPQAWAWPAKGPILTTFAAGQNTHKGIDIAGSEGSAVLAAGDGEVVYSGDSLRGYGNLIIIKHQKNFLSAYAHNRKNMVKEGERVVIGQRIAEMGQTGTDKVKLHFEVRHHGKPIDPQGVLPGKK